MDSSLDKETLRFFDQDLIAKSCIQVFFDISKEEDFYRKAFTAKETLTKKYPENVVLKNTIDYFMTNLHNTSLSEQTKNRRSTIFHELTNNQKKIAKFANTKIKRGAKVFFHSINNHLHEIARHKDKEYEILLLEHPTLPINRAFFEKHAKYSKIFPDLSLKEAIHKTDICFLGAEAINEDFVMVKNGSSLVVREAKENHIPIYVCASSWRYSDQARPADHHHEMLHTKDMSGIILEHGIFEPKEISKEIDIISRTRR